MENIIRAIRMINPKAVVCVSGNNLDTCKIEWLEKTTPISKNDIKKKILELDTLYSNEKINKENKKKSALAKLKKLGLDEDEIKALF